MYPFDLITYRQIILLTFTLLAAGDLTAAGKKPKVLTLIGSEAVIGINDNGQPGATPGDIRTLTLKLSTPAGFERGRAEVVQTLTQEIGEVGTAVKVGAIRLAEGTIEFQGTVRFLNFTDPSARPLDGTEELAITGGTGTYRGAAGEINIDVLPAFQSRWILRFSR